MGLVKLDDAQPGMVLGREVRDRSGRLLLGGGHEITDKALKILRMWGVSEVDIEGLETAVEPVDPVIDPAVMEQARARVDLLFRHADIGHAMIAELARISTERHARRPRLQRVS